MFRHSRGPLLAGAWIGLALLTTSTFTSTASAIAAEPLTAAIDRPTAALKPGTEDRPPAEPETRQASPAASAQTPDPCALFTADEAAAVIGPLSYGPAPIKSDTGVVVMCQLAKGRSFITVEVKDANRWDYLTDTGSYHATSVDGLGDKATFLWSDTGASALYVMKSPYILDIGVAGDNVTNLVYARNLAEMALPRLP